MNEQEREKWYRYHHEKYGIPVAYLKREFEEELSGRIAMDQPAPDPGQDGSLLQIFLWAAVPVFSGNP